MFKDIQKFINPDGFSVIAHFSLSQFVSSSEVGYVTNAFSLENDLVFDYLKKDTYCNDEKIFQACSLVKLNKSLLSLSYTVLTNVEKRKVQLAHLLLLHSKVLVLDHFFDDFIYSEKEYFKCFFRNLIHKQHIAILLLEDDMNFICEIVKQFYLFIDKTHYKLISDFYDDEIYQYVDMPYTVELIKYFESCGYSIDHEITFNETLKAIYRGVA